MNALGASDDELGVAQISGKGGGRPCSSRKERRLLRSSKSLRGRFGVTTGIVSQ